MGQFLRRLLYMWRASRAANDLREELDLHCQLRQAQLERDGLSAADAAKSSRQLLGNVMLAEEDARAVWMARLDSVVQDVRAAARALRTHRSLAALASATLVLCLAANLVVFTIVNALWLRPSPVRDARQVVTIMSLETAGEQGFLFGDLGVERLRRDPTFTSVAGQVATSSTLAGNRPHVVLDRGAGPVETLAVTPEYFTVVDVPLLGRDFTTDDDQPGAAPVAIISDRLWKRTFGGDSAVIGRIVPSMPVPLRVVGIAAPNFHGARLGEQIDVWIPRALTVRVALPDMAQRSPSLLVLARLRPGLDAAEAERIVNRVSAEPEPSREPIPPGFVRDTSSFRRHMDLVPVERVFGSPVRGTFVTREHGLMGVAAVTAALVLAGGCATLATLVLVGYERRRQEIAVRMALGCSSGRLRRTLGIELGAVILIGAAGGVLLAGWGLQALPSVTLPGGLDLNRLDLRADWRVGLFGLMAATITVSVAAGLPMRRATVSTVVGDLAVSSARATSSSLRSRRALLAVQVATTIVVLAAAGLFVQTVARAFGGEAGFATDRTLFVDVQARSTTIIREDQRAREQRVAVRLRALLDSLRRLPGVEAVALGAAPLGPNQTILAGRARVVGLETRVEQLPVSILSVSPDYLPALGASLLGGRPLTESDVRVGSADERPALISASLARALWPDQSAIGRRLSISDVRCEVVGVVSDIAQGSLTLNQRSAAYVATNFDRVARNHSFQLVLRTTGDSSAVVRAVRTEIADEFPWSPRVDLATGEEIISRDLGRERLGAWFFSGFALVALGLGIGGVFGLAGHLVETRRREMGIRLALGATTGTVLRLALRASLLPVFFGLVTGLMAAASLAAVSRASLPGIQPLDIPMSAAVAGLMLACAGTAGLLGAWRVRRISAADALRTE